MKTPAALLITLSLFLSADAGNLIFTMRQNGEAFDEAYKGLRTELQGVCELKDYIVSPKSTVADISSRISQLQPKLIVLMDNTSISLFRKYQETLGKTDPVPPSIAIMSVMVKESLHNLRNASGISYEIPVVTSLVSLRSALGTAIKKVGIIHRAFLSEFLDENRKFCSKEGFELVSVALPNKQDNTGTALKKALKNLKKNNVDVLWIPNDNALLHPSTIRNIWIPAVRKLKIPVIVGVEVLVNPELNFGTFAVLPDHVSLGGQAAEMILEIIDNHWTINSMRVEPPLAVYKIINLPQAKRYFHVSDDNLKSIDKKLK